MNRRRRGFFCSFYCSPYAVVVLFHVRCKTFVSFHIFFVFLFFIFSRPIDRSRKRKNEYRKKYHNYEGIFSLLLSEYFNWHCEQCFEIVLSFARKMASERRDECRQSALQSKQKETAEEKKITYRSIRLTFVHFQSWNCFGSSFHLIVGWPIEWESGIVYESSLTQAYIEQ